MATNEDSRSSAEGVVHPMRRATDRLDRDQFLIGGGEMAKVIRAKDWSATPLGPIESWSTGLRTTVSLALASNFPINITWRHVQIYNDGYWPICGAKHPASMGQDFRECWASAFPVIGRAYERAWAGEASYIENQRMFLDRNGYLEETFFTFSFSPIRSESGQVEGLFHPVTETTPRMLSERRVRALRDVAARAGKATTAEEACHLAMNSLADCELDVPFVLVYRASEDRFKLDLVGTTGLRARGAFAPESVSLRAMADEGWPLGAALSAVRPILVDDLQGRFGPMDCGPYPESPTSAFLLPICIAGVSQPFGVIVAGVSSRLPLDEAYRDFFELLGAAVNVVIGNARAHEEERRRAEALAEIDRAKTAFFSNVSHEFRTPLTLMLGPADDLLNGVHGDIDEPQRAQLELVRRNGLRLQRLVNTLLEFSRIEANRAEASYEPLELGSVTRDLASSFRSAVERAGLQLNVDCPPLPEAVYVDCYMWEHIVLNLISNAFKFTLQGEIDVRLVATDGNAVLSVRDTGVGIPAHELSRIFERFHRVNAARGRTHEGTGIGLALVHELVKLHGGTVRAESSLATGSLFVVSVPLGSAHLPPEHVRTTAGRTRSVTDQEAFVEEAVSWLPSCAQGRAGEPMLAVLAGDSRPRIVWADDNSDMRGYVRTLLGKQFNVESVADGQAALEAALANPPDLVLSDIMMPRLDGVGLLRALREDPRTRDIPIVLLSARAGEEARIAGMQEGADDYLIKPFSARELLARVGAHIRIARLRREAIEAARRSEESLRASQEQLALALHAAGMCAWEWDPVSDRTSASDSAVEVFGLLPGETLGSSAAGLRLVHPDDLERHSQLIQRAVERCESWHTELRIIRPRDGRIAWLEERATVKREPLTGRVHMTGLVWDVTERKQTEVALQRAHDELETRVARRTAELAQSNERLRAEARERERAELARTELLRKLATAQEDERRRLSRELHDGVGQEITALVLGLALLARELPEEALGCARLRELERTIGRLGREVHDLAVELRPTALDDLGLGAALAAYVERWSTRTGVSADFQPLRLDGDRLPPDIETTVYRIVQEALNNIAKHAAARQVSVVVERRARELLAFIEDDGRGFDVEGQPGVSTPHLGLIGMRERLALVGGTLFIDSSPGRGTTVRATIGLV